MHGHCEDSHIGVSVCPLERHAVNSGLCAAAAYFACARVAMFPAAQPPREHDRNGAQDRTDGAASSSVSTEPSFVELTVQ